MEVPEPASDLLARAKRDAWRRVQADLERLTGAPRALLERLADRLREPGAETLLPPGVDAAELEAAAQAGPRALEQFHAALGIDLRGYLSRLNVKAAKELLRYRDLKVWAIASFAGYSGLQPFWRAFKTATGHSPSEYREQSEPRRRRRAWSWRSRAASTSKPTSRPWRPKIPICGCCSGPGWPTPSGW